MHKLLKRQLRKFFGGEETFPAELGAFVAAINDSYEGFDSDQKILHRAMELSSQELTQANSELRVVFHAIPDLILKFDRAGNIIALKATEEFDAKPEEGHFLRRQISNKISQLPHPAIRERFNEALQKLFGDGQTKTFEYSTSTEFGESYFEVRLVPLLEDGAIAIIQDITKRKQAEAELERIHQQLMQASRQAGMAEVATGVLHNVGNVLNSVNVSATILREGLNKSQIANLVRATSMLRDHVEDTATFLVNDPQGQRLPGYLIRLGDRLAVEQATWQKELDGLRTNLEHIKEIVAMQQSHARVTGVTESLNAPAMLEEAVRMNANALLEQGVMVIRHIQDVPLVAADKHKVLQILVNLIRNAKQAMRVSQQADKQLRLSVFASGEKLVKIEIADNGPGIAPENLTRIFQHGFTTKADGHGFGLHSSANAAREMQGRLSVHSNGLGTGATFTLELPVAVPGKPAARVPTEFIAMHQI